MTKLPGSSGTVLFILRTILFANTILGHYSRTLFTKTLRTLRAGLRVTVLEATPTPTFPAFTSLSQLVTLQPVPTPLPSVDRRKADSVRSRGGDLTSYGRDVGLKGGPEVRGIAWSKASAVILSNNDEYLLRIAMAVS